MPTYDYVCPKCGKFEHFQGIKEEPLRECPQCGQLVKRQIGGGAGLIFKGSGFYITDYRGEEYRKKAGEEKIKPGDKKKEGTEPAKTETAARQESPPEKAQPTQGDKAAAGKDAAGGEK